MRDEIRRLRAALARRDSGPGKRFTPEIRHRISDLGRRLRADGASWRGIGDELGLRVATVQRLCDRASAGFAAVEVIDDRGGLTLVTPTGYRVEGLTLAAVAELVRKLA